jgi:hypothetical protein
MIEWRHNHHTLLSTTRHTDQRMLTTLDSLHRATTSIAQTPHLPVQLQQQQQRLHRLRLPKAPGQRWLALQQCDDLRGAWHAWTPAIKTCWTTHRRHFFSRPANLRLKQPSPHWTSEPWTRRFGRTTFATARLNASCSDKRSHNCVGSWASSRWIGGALRRRQTGGFDTWLQGVCGHMLLARSL